MTRIILEDYSCCNLFRRPIPNLCGTPSPPQHCCVRCSAALVLRQSGSHLVALPFPAPAHGRRRENAYSKRAAGWSRLKGCHERDDQLIGRALLSIVKRGVKPAIRDACTSKRLEAFSEVSFMSLEAIRR